MGTTEKKTPDEVIRCLRICQTAGFICWDAARNPCSYREFDNGKWECHDRLLADAADLLAATYNKRGREL